MNPRCELCGAILPADQLRPVSGKMACGLCRSELSHNPMLGVDNIGKPATTAESDAIRLKIRRLNRLSFIWFGSGVAISAIGQFLLFSGSLHSTTTGRLAGCLVLMLSGSLLIMYALSCYARMRARSAWFALFGLLHLVGFFILFFLPKRCHRCSASAPFQSKSCIKCGAPV